MTTAQDWVRRARSNLATTGVFCDFDGTLSNVVGDPTAAVAATGANDALEALAPVVGRLLVVSGRPVSFLETVVSPAIELSGLYGLESRVDGVYRAHPDVVTWADVVAEVADAAEQRFEPSWVERKGFSMTVHYRSDPAVRDDVAAWAAEAAARTGLVARPARLSVEVHPPIERTKGSVIVEESVGMTHVAYAGDDLGDLPAFAAVADLRDRGLDGLCIAVTAEELPEPVREATDVILPGPEAMVDLLNELSVSEG